MSTTPVRPARWHVATAHAAVALAVWVLSSAANAAPTATAGPGPAAAAAIPHAAIASGPHGLNGMNGKSSRPQARPVPVERIDINSASLKQLMTLPGIGQAEAKKIVANRHYLSKAELVHKGVLPTGPYLSLKDRIIALQKKPAKGRS